MDLMSAPARARAGHATRRRPVAEVPTRPLNAALSRLAFAARRKQRARCQDIALLAKAVLAKPIGKQPEKSEKQFEEQTRADESEEYDDESEDDEDSRVKYIVIEVPVACQNGDYGQYCDYGRRNDHGQDCRPGVAYPAPVRLAEAAAVAAAAARERRSTDHYEKDSGCQHGHELHSTSEKQECSYAGNAETPKGHAGKEEEALIEPDNTHEIPHVNDVVIPRTTSTSRMRRDWPPPNGPPDTLDRNEKCDEEEQRGEKELERSSQPNRVAAYAALRKEGIDGPNATILATMAARGLPIHPRFAAFIPEFMVIAGSSAAARPAHLHEEEYEEYDEERDEEYEEEAEEEAETYERGGPDYEEGDPDHEEDPDHEKKTEKQKQQEHKADREDAAHEKEGTEDSKEDGNATYEMDGDVINGDAKTDPHRKKRDPDDAKDEEDPEPNGHENNMDTNSPELDMEEGEKERGELAKEPKFTTDTHNAPGAGGPALDGEPLKIILAGIKTGNIAEVQAGLQEAQRRGTTMAPNIRVMIAQWLTKRARKLKTNQKNEEEDLEHATATKPERDTDDPEKTNRERGKHDATRRPKRVSFHIPDSEDEKEDHSTEKPAKPETTEAPPAWRPRPPPAWRPSLQPPPNNLAGWLRQGMNNFDP